MKKTIWRICAILGIIFTLVWACVMKLVHIPTDGMFPTYDEGQHVTFIRVGLINESHRGKILLFKHSSLIESSTKPILLMKRLVGLPGDVISTKGNCITSNGIPVSLVPYGSSSSNFPNKINFDTPFTIPAGEYFFIGDNYENSLDGRYFGLVKESAISHRALIHHDPPSLNFQTQ